MTGRGAATRRWRGRVSESAASNRLVGLVLALALAATSVELRAEPVAVRYTEGLAHGFLVLSETAEVQYKCTNHYSQAAECGLAWNDPAIGIAWPVANPILSERDRHAPSLREYLQNPAFRATPVARAS